MTKKPRQPTTKRSNISLANRLFPKTQGHEEYIRAIAENDYVMVKGPAGSSKTYTAVGMACRYLADGDIQKIWLTRPMIQTGRSGIGFLKGDIEEKFNPYLGPLYDHFEYFLGEAQFRMLRAFKVIDTCPLELMRGSNLKDSFTIGDEMQNADYDQIKMILTRLCDGSKMVLTGDVKQNDLSRNAKQCDFDIAFQKLQNLEGLGTVELHRRDIMRGPLIGKILERLED